MIGKRAKLLSAKNVEDLLVFSAQTRHPVRNEVLVLLSVKAGLRAGEIANLTWPMLVEPTGESPSRSNCKTEPPRKGSDRVIPIHPHLHATLVKLAQLTLILDGPVVQSERGGPMTPVSIVSWFGKAFRRSGWTAAHPIPAAGPSLPGQPGWSTRQAALSATSKCWQGIGLY